MGSDGKNGTADPHVQASLFTEEEPSGAEAVPEEDSTTEDAAAQAAPAEPTEPAVVALGNTHDGCWVEVEGEARRELDEEAWRRELARLFARPTHAAAPDPQ